MDPRVEVYKSAFSHQHPPYQWGGAADIPVFAGANHYQYGEGIGDVLRGLWRFFRPVAIKGAQTLLKTGSEAIKEGATASDILKSTLKPTKGVVLGATAEQLASRLTDNRPAAAPPPGPALEALAPVTGQTGSGSRKRGYSVYKSTFGESFKQPFAKRTAYSSRQKF